MRPRTKNIGGDQLVRDNDPHHHPELEDDTPGRSTVEHLPAAGQHERHQRDEPHGAGPLERPLVDPWAPWSHAVVCSSCSLLRCLQRGFDVAHHPEVSATSAGLTESSGKSASA